MHLYFQSGFFCLLSSSHAHRMGLRSYILFRAHFTIPHDLLPKKEQDFHPALMCMNCTINYFSFLLRIIPVIPTPAPNMSVIIIAIGYASPVETALSVFLSDSVVFGTPACVVAPSGCSTDVGRILRTFKIKKNVEVTDNGKIII